MSAITTPADVVFEAEITAGEGVLTFGYWVQGHGQSDTGSIDKDTFILNGKYYKLTRVTYHPAEDNITIETVPWLTASEVAGLKITIGDTVYRSGWTTSSSRQTVDANGQTIATGDKVRFIIEDAGDNDDAPGDLPAGADTLSAVASPGEIALLWAAPDDDETDKWQYRVNPPDSADFGSWKDIASSDQDTRTATVDGLDVGYNQFQVRPYNTQNGGGEPSPTATAVVPELVWKGTVEVGSDANNNWYGWHYDIHSSLIQRPVGRVTTTSRQFTLDGDTYRISLLAMQRHGGKWYIAWRVADTNNNPRTMSADVRNALVFSIDGVEITGGWAQWGSAYTYHQTPPTGINFHLNQRDGDLNGDGFRDDVGDSAGDKIEVVISKAIPDALKRQPEALEFHSTTITVGDGGGGFYGYWSGNAGSMADTSITYGGATYAPIVRLV